jgi:hypothetical protein
MIADRLKVSKQLVSNWLSGYRTISLDEWTQIQAVINKETAGTQFFEENTTMKIIVDAPKPPRQAAGSNPDFPRNLEAARLRIASLNQEIVQLKAAAASSPGKTASLPSPSPIGKAKAASTGADAPPFPPITTPNADRPNQNEMQSGPAAPSKALPPEANTPVLIQKILDVTTLDDLRLLLNNPIHTPTQQSVIYAEIRKRRALVENCFQ